MAAADLRFKLVLAIWPHRTDACGMSFLENVDLYFKVRFQWTIHGDIHWLYLVSSMTRQRHYYRMVLTCILKSRIVFVALVIVQQ